MKTELLNHPKFWHLLGLLSHVERPLVVGLLELLYQSTYAKGNPDFKNSKSLELAAGWSGEPGELAAALVESTLVDEVGEKYRIHDWFDHLPRSVARRRTAWQWAHDNDIEIPDWVRNEQDRYRWVPNGTNMNQYEPKGTESVNVGTNPDPDPDPDPDPEVKKKYIRKKFRRPTAEEVQIYLDEKKETRFTGQDFYDSNEAKGWVVGTTKTPMKDWQAVVRTWISNRDKNGEPQKNIKLKLKDPRDNAIEFCLAWGYSEDAVLSYEKATGKIPEKVGDLGEMSEWLDSQQ